MSIEKNIDINTHYTRSINLERDSDSLAVVDAYIPTSRAISTFNRLTETFGKVDAPRAWALVGPYGSGKSSFAVFLSHLLTDPSGDSFKAAKKVLNRSDKSLTKKVDKELKGTSGYCKVLLTGSPEPLAQRFVISLYDAAVSFWSTKRGRVPAIVTELEKLSKKKEPKVSSIIDSVQNLQDALAKVDGTGLLVVFDELGKFLEYEARHPGGNDIFLLQALAEHAVTGHDANLYIYVLLHQAFDQYAKGLGESLKNEWAKVQGRYENIPFLESSEQILRIVSAAFTHNYDTKNKTEIKKFAANAADVLDRNNALPSIMTTDAAEDIFANCYPLHPVSALILPILCQKVAQNERTLFSYLGSNEKHGFKDSLKVIENVGEWIYPWEIYDYFILNQPAALSDHFTHRRWAEVVTAIERLGDAELEQINLLKTIGLLNIIGVHGGFKASKDIIELCLPKKSDVKNVTDNLIGRSIVQYRKFSGEFRVWQGSDFDIEAAINDENNQLGRIELANELNSRKSLLPIVARKYTIKNGTLRYFQPMFIDAESCLSQPVKDKTPRILFFLAETAEDKEVFKNNVLTHFSDLDITIFCDKGTQIRQAVTDVIALQRVQVNCPELHSDPIAQREYNDRAAAAAEIENELLTSLTAYPEDSEWYWKGEKLTVNHQRDLQFVMSDILNECFSKCPVIHNEMINRDFPSSQANSARNKLLFAMMNHAGSSELGITQFPPEKAIYLSVLREMGLHKKDKESADGSWKFVAPSKRSSLYHVWQRIDDFFNSTDKQAKSLVELNAILLAPPYGVKAGILPILYIAAYIVYQHELALYENRVFKPTFTEEMLERFVKRPDTFTFQRFKISGLNASLFEQYSKVIHGDTKKRTLLELAQPLAQFMGGLPKYAQTTKRELSPEAIAVRIAFNYSKSPERLLFDELPKAVGFKDLNEKSDDTVLEKFAHVLTNVLRELRDCHTNLVDKEKTLLAQAFNLKADLSLSELRKVIYGHCHGLENYTVDIQGLRAFILRLTKEEGSDKEWLENALVFLGEKPTKKWDDTDQDKAEYRLSDYSRRVIDLEKIRLHEKASTKKLSGDYDVYLLRSIKKGGEFLDQVVAVDDDSSVSINPIKEQIKNTLNDLANDELKLAALAEVVDEFLMDYNAIELSKKKPKTSTRKTKRKTGDAA